MPSQAVGGRQRMRSAYSIPTGRDMESGASSEARMDMHAGLSLTQPVDRDDSPLQGTRILCVLFFFSGFPALIYQLVWQRALFRIFGVNIESVTIVVSAFMLGLGLGSLGGGWLSERRAVPLLAVFGIAELGIGLFGVCSLGIFHYVAQFTAGTSALGTGAMAFVLLLV